MKITNKKMYIVGLLAMAVAGVSTFLSSCGSDDSNFQQIEHLGRPGFNELFVVKNANLEDYNKNAPGTVSTDTAADFTAILTALNAFASKNSLSPQDVSNIAAGFLPDVMRINTSKASGYAASTCGTSSGVQLCGGRLLTDDVVKISYSYILNGKASGCSALDCVDDNVTYAGKSGNAATGHTAVRSTFPYIPGPYASQQ